MPRQIKTVLFLLVILLPSNGASVLGANELINEFLGNLRKAPKIGIISVESSYPEPHVKLSGNSEVRLLPGHMSIRSKEVRMEEEGITERVLIANPYYSAHLGDKKSGWLVSGVESSESGKYARTQDTPVGIILNPAGILTFDYTIESTTTEAISGRKYSVVKVKIDSPEPDDFKEAKFWFIQDDAMDLSRVYPARMEIVMNRGTTGTYIFSSHVTIAGCKLPTIMQGCIGIFTSEEWSSDTPPKIGATHNFDYSNIDSKPIAKEFFLTHFGVPEPDYYSPPNSWWLYASVAGLGVVLVGVLLLQLGRRLKKRN